MSDPLTLDAARSPGSRRMARYRLRRRNQLRTVIIELREAEIDQLIHLQLIAPDSRTDAIALRNAVHSFLDQVFPVTRNSAGVKSLSTATPFSHPIETPDRRWFRLVPVANRRDPRGAE